VVEVKPLFVIVNLNVLFVFDIFSFFFFVFFQRLRLSFVVCINKEISSSS